MIDTTSLKDRAGRKCQIMGDLESIQQQRGLPLQRKVRCRNTEKEKLISRAQTFNRIAASTGHFIFLLLLFSKLCGTGHFPNRWCPLTLSDSSYTLPRAEGSRRYQVY